MGGTSSKSSQIHKDHEGTDVFANETNESNEQKECGDVRSQQEYQQPQCQEPPEDLSEGTLNDTDKNPQHQSSSGETLQEASKTDESLEQQKSIEEKSSERLGSSTVSQEGGSQAEVESKKIGAKSVSRPEICAGNV